MSAPARNPVAPVTPGRVSQALRAQGYSVDPLGDGVLAGAWDGNAFTVSLVGDAADVLEVRGTWHQKIDEELAAGVAQMLNDWNRDRIWPKVYSAPSADGIRAHAEVCLDVSDGVTDDQLAEVLACGLGTGVQFFEALADLIER